MWRTLLHSEPTLHTTEPTLHTTEPTLHTTESTLLSTEPTLHTTEPTLHSTDRLHHRLTLVMSVSDVLMGERAVQPQILADVRCGKSLIASHIMHPSSNNL